MKFSVNQQDLQQALNYCQGVIEKRSTLQILSNIMLNVENSKLTITATDLDLIFIHEINNIEVAEEGKYTYIFDKSMGTLLYAEDSENIISKVKKKLGL